MIIIIEGENKTGKTTLSKFLINNLENYEYFKFSQPKDNAYFEYLNFLYNCPPNAIIDRFHIGEMVYGPIYRGKSDLDLEKFEKIENEIKKFNGILIYCYDDLNNIMKRFKSDKEEWAKQELIKNVLEKYDEIVNNVTTLNKFFHKIKSKDDLTRNNKIIELIKIYEKRNNKLY